MVARASLAAGDLAHGLKTPLAILTQDGERAARDGHADLAASIAAQVDRMRRQVDTHLARARLDVSRHRAVVAGAVAGIDRGHRPHAGAALRRARDRVRRARCRRTSRCWRRGRISTRFSATSSITPASGRARPVASTPVSRPGRVVIVIDDDGPGIPGRCATACRRAECEPTRPPGSGLGLSIAHDLADAYGGRTSLDDSPLGGLRVVIELQAPRTGRRRIAFLTDGPHGQHVSQIQANSLREGE